MKNKQSSPTTAAVSAPSVAGTDQISHDTPLRLRVAGNLSSPNRLISSPPRPRMLTREQAAAYCGLSVRGFSRWVRQGLLPAAIPGTARWDLKAIDIALDSASGLSTTVTSPLEQWRANRARAAQRDS